MCACVYARMGVCAYACAVPVVLYGADTLGLKRAQFKLHFEVMQDVTHAYVPVGAALAQTPPPLHTHTLTHSHPVRPVWWLWVHTQVPEAVLGWKVAKLPLRRTARHLDNTMVLDFYAKLDAFLASKRCALDY